MPESYFFLVRREPLLTAYWRQNDPSGNLDMIDYGSHFSLTGVYSSRSRGPSLIQGDSGSTSSGLGAAGSASVANASPLHIIGDISIEAWIVPYTSALTCNIVSKQDSGAAHGGPFAMKLVGGQISFGLGNGTGDHTVVGGTPATSLPSHIVATCFRGAMTVYLNGVAVATGTLGAQVVADSGQPMVIGKTSTEAGISLVSEVALYSGALSARRVARHFAVGQQILSDPAHFSLVDPPVSA